MCIFDKSLCDADPADPGTTEYLFLKQLVFSYYSTLTASSHRYTVDYLLPHWAGCSLRIATMVVWSLVLSEYGCLVFQWCPTLVTSWTVAHQAPLSIRFPSKNTGAVAISFSGQSSQPRDCTHICCVSCHWQTDSSPLSHQGSPFSK